MAHSFFGGIHPDGKKTSTHQKPIEILPPPAQIVLPMSMHIGAHCTPLVQKGDKVKLGQKIGDSAAAVSAQIHATVSGTVIAVEPRPHPNGTSVLSVVIENDFQDTLSEEATPNTSADRMTVEQLVAIVKNAGIVGLGGAAFPTHIKIASGLGKVDTVIVNGAECEPYITSDHRLMLEYPDEIIGGARLLIKIFGLKKITIGIEANKHDAIDSLRSKLPIKNSDIAVQTLRIRYPQGAEKQLIQTVTGRQIAPGQLPASMGCAVFNVGTTAAIYRAVYQGMPVIDRIVTLSGSAISFPKNLNVRIGTPLSALIEAAGGFQKSPNKVIMGGPMMGVAQYDLSAPVIKATNALLAFSEKEDKSQKNPTCIRCGKCVSVCPMHLLPLFMYMYESKDDLDALKKLNISDCIECGSCSYICPGRLHLVQSFRTAKQKIINAGTANAEVQKNG